MLILRYPLLWRSRKAWTLAPNSRSIKVLTRTPRTSEVYPIRPKDVEPVVDKRQSRLFRKTKLGYGPEDALPPRVILESARKSGAMDVSPDEALSMLRRYQELERQEHKDWEEELCKGQPHPVSIWRWTNK
jgi:hypothetical protein